MAFVFLVRCVELDLFVELGVLPPQDFSCFLQEDAAAFTTCHPPKHEEVSHVVKLRDRQELDEMKPLLREAYLHSLSTAGRAIHD